MSIWAAPVSGSRRSAICLLFKRLQFMALAGNTVLDKQALRPGGSRLLRARGKHEATITDDEGREIHVEMMLR